MHSYDRPLFDLDIFTTVQQEKNIKGFHLKLKMLVYYCNTYGQNFEKNKNSYMAT